VWTATSFDSAKSAGVVLRYTSPDGDQGYPGRLDVTATYTLTDDDKLWVAFLATSDKATPVNLAQHSYFNLAGDAPRDILGHILQLNASRFTPVDATLIPTGELASVSGTPFDFRAPMPIGARIGARDQQLRFAGGYDHNFVIDPIADVDIVLAARVVEPSSGRTLEVSTDQPGVQFYSGNFLDGTITGKSGRVYKRRTGFCLETQKFPDSPNHTEFPATILYPGSHYQATTVYTFGVVR
jgi:aldose 1-epimerase